MMTLTSPIADRELRNAPAGGRQDARGIRSMFGEITPSYDRLNALLSGALDRRWRRRAARNLTEGLSPCIRVLDVATGTGDLANDIGSLKPEARITGLDFTRPMLAEARRKYGLEQMRWIEGDGLSLPFASESFDGASIAFGLRNMEDRRAALREFARVLRPGGRLAILEFSQPRGALMRRFYDFYSFRVMPRVGKWLSGSDAYLYLPESIRLFWNAEELSKALSEAGFCEVRHETLTGGVVALHVAVKPSQKSGANDE